MVLWFVFSVTMFVCVGFMCKLFFFVKDFSGTTEPRILKFGINVEYSLLYCVRENQLPPAYHCHYLFMFFSQIKISVTDFSASMSAKVFKFCIPLDLKVAKCIVGKKIEMLRLIFAFFSIFAFFHLSFECNT